MKHKRKKVSQLLRLHTIIYYTKQFKLLQVQSVNFPNIYFCSCKLLA